MATVYSRKNNDGSETWRVIIRRKNIPTFCLTFSSEEEARAWVDNHEFEYIKNPKSYHDWIEGARLDLQRAREFN
jgi:hypothetical protein